MSLPEDYLFNNATNKPCGFMDAYIRLAISLDFVGQVNLLIIIFSIKVISYYFDFLVN